MMVLQISTFMCMLISAAAWTLLYLLDHNADTATHVII